MFKIRAVRKEDWAQAKEIRLAALQDPLAKIAFIDQYESLVHKPDDFWRQRVAVAAEGKTIGQLIAEDAQGRWQATITLIVELPGVESFEDIPEVAQTHIVGVFVRPEARGTGLASQLLQEALNWSWQLVEPSVERVHLWVHENNVRAESAYKRAGFIRTGRSCPFPGDSSFTEYELEVTRP
ncbi:MAG: GNAT family N-acetyltransferase [Corynebacteriales bacterium]|nr:GNAT family N-acetyltransferase [Mycobacteriales bacterium]